MATYKDIKIVYLNEASLTDVLLTILSENGECTKHLQSIAENISGEKEEEHNA